MIEVVDFPTFKISEQIFHVPGGAIEGGLTSGGARILTPEPGGIAMLEIRPALQTNEFEYPLSAWLMSKINGEPLRIRLAPTPQVLRAPTDRPWDNTQPWEHGQPWSADMVSTFTAVALKGSTSVVIDMTGIAGKLRPGHVFGHADVTYLVDKVTYDTSGNIATVVTKPPLRKNISIGDMCHFRPYFTGVITNGREIVQTYNAADQGHIQLTKIVMTEARI